MKAPTATLLLTAVTALVLAWALAVTSVSSKEEKQAKIQQRQVTISMPASQVDLPPGPGKRIFEARCMVCHSLRYITMQPDFPEKVWVKEVDKMVKNYGARLTPEESKEIVKYLVEIKGLKK